MSAFACGRLERSRLTRLSVRIGLVGATLGLLAGIAELTAGPSIRPWIGNKADTTMLGLATLALSTIALVCALRLGGHAHDSAPVRTALAVGMLLPGLICFTTVGRLWYVPGALLVTAATLGATDLWPERRRIVAVTARNWGTALTLTLAAFHVFLGATALGTVGVLGIVGGIVVLLIFSVRTRISTPWAVTTLLVATVPFAVLTWWSVATPVTALLLLAIGIPALTVPRRPGPSLDRRRLR